MSKEGGGGEAGRNEEELIRKEGPYLVEGCDFKTEVRNGMQR